jgi:hypothetical protein
MRIHPSCFPPLLLYTLHYANSVSKKRKKEEKKLECLSNARREDEEETSIAGMWWV